MWMFLIRVFTLVNINSSSHCVHTYLFTVHFTTLLISCNKKHILLNNVPLMDWIYFEIIFYHDFFRFIAGSPLFISLSMFRGLYNTMICTFDIFWRCRMAGDYQMFHEIQELRSHVFWFFKGCIANFLNKKKNRLI